MRDTDRCRYSAYDCAKILPYSSPLLPTLPPLVEEFARVPPYYSVLLFRCLCSPTRRELFTISTRLLCFPAIYRRITQRRIKMCLGNSPAHFSFLIFNSRLKLARSAGSASFEYPRDTLRPLFFQCNDSRISRVSEEILNLVREFFSIAPRDFILVSQSSIIRCLIIVHKPQIMNSSWGKRACLDVHVSFFLFALSEPTKYKSRRAL